MAKLSEKYEAIIVFSLKKTEDETCGVIGFTVGII